VAGYEERYDEPLGPALDRLWRERAAGDGAWVTRRADDAAIDDSGRFWTPAGRTFAARMTRPAEDVVGVENTRATSLGWPEDVRRDFNAELRRALGGRAEVGLTLEASVTLARVR
jgi:hypothetical protein